MAEHSSAIPKEKETVLGLYLTAAEAWKKWQAEPDKVLLLDVRTPEEFLFVGHPPMAWNIPIAALATSQRGSPGFGATIARPNSSRRISRARSTRCQMCLKSSQQI